jgi:hypothetical protein
LWVTLTLKLVMQNLEDGETMATIRAQVDLLPEELEDFFTSSSSPSPNTNAERPTVLSYTLYTCLDI